MSRITRRTARKPHRCECGRHVMPGDIYLEHVISPQHDDVGNDTWWRAVECSGCAWRNGRGEMAL